MTKYVKIHGNNEYIQLKDICISHEIKFQKKNQMQAGGSNEVE